MKLIKPKLKYKKGFNKLRRPSIIVIHHAKHSSATVEDIHLWHLEKGWSGFGYQYYITKNGQIYIGRPEWAIGAHTMGYNSIAIGICVQGNYDEERMSEAQFEAVVELCNYLCQKYDISIVKGHRELKATRCPGMYFPLSELREAIFGKIDTYTVKAGDTLWSIAEYFNISVSSLIRLNGLNGSLIYPNQILRIL
ncbi:N-acetylmuramoyl-L-alanine amidase [Wukongibacter baidiensis]